MTTVWGRSLTFLQPLPLPQLNTNIADKERVDPDDAPQSVIHAPAGFKHFVRLPIRLRCGEHTN
jgi:hypothetical protein